MKVIVAGGAEFIGSHTVDALTEHDHQVKAEDKIFYRDVDTVSHLHGRCL